MIATPLVVAVAPRLVDALLRRDRESEPPAADAAARRAPQVVLVGYGKNAEIEAAFALLTGEE